jgi:hypothetical protein
MGARFAMKISGRIVSWEDLQEIGSSPGRANADLAHRPSLSETNSPAPHPGPSEKSYRPADSSKSGRS